MLNYNYFVNLGIETKLDFNRIDCDSNLRKLKKKGVFRKLLDTFYFSS